MSEHGDHPEYLAWCDCACDVFQDRDSGKRLAKIVCGQTFRHQ